jgi:Tfp pilus assembly protein PilF
MEPGSPQSQQPADAASVAPPLVADHELIRVIGRGAYGEVWLARHIRLGTLRAVKIVRRDQFGDARPFQREFSGIQKYEPISRGHPNLVPILHVGGDDDCFYYVMELAEPVFSNQCSVFNNQSPGADSTSPATSLNTGHWLLNTSSPRTLRSELKQHGALPIDRVLEIGHALASALAHLHAHKLVHRDVKPSNVIFVGGVAKLADIGLVAGVDEAHSLAGTAGYVPFENPGTPSADCYSLGKLLYELSTGHDGTAWPEPPADLATRPDRERLLELNAIIHRACAPDPLERYANAEALLADVDRLGGGKSVRRAHQVKRRWHLVRRGAGWLAAAAVVAIMIALASRMSQPRATFEGAKRSTNSFANDQYDLGVSVYRRAGDLNAAAKHFQAATNADPNFLLAQADLARSWSWGGRLPLGYDQHPHLTEAVGIARRVLARDDNLSGAHMVVAWHAFIRERDWKEATRHFEKAIRCDPNNWEPHEWYGSFLGAIGRTNEAISQIEIAGRLGGSEPDVNFFFGGVLFAARRYAEAAEKFRKSLEMPEMSDKGFHYSQLAEAELWTDWTDQAIEKWVDATYGAKEAWVSDLKRVLHEQGQTAFWDKHLEAVRERTKDPLILADACAMAGRTTEALDFLEQAYHEHHDFWLAAC